MEANRSIYKRNYKLMIPLIFHVVVFFFVKSIFDRVIARLTNVSNPFRFDNEPEKSLNFYSLLQKEINLNNIFFGIFLFLSVLIILYFTKILHEKVASGTFLRGIIYAWLFYTAVSLLFQFEGPPFTQSHNDNKNLYLSYIQFIPYFLIFYRYVLIGEKVDMAPIIKKRTEILYQDNLEDLSRLLKLNLITKENYEEKLAILVKDRISSEIKSTEEYLLLIKSKEKKIISDAEFDTQILHLISSRYNQE